MTPHYFLPVHIIREDACPVSALVCCSYLDIILCYLLLVITIGLQLFSLFLPHVFSNAAILIFFCYGFFPPFMHVSHLFYPTGTLPFFICQAQIQLLLTGVIQLCSALYEVVTDHGIAAFCLEHVTTYLCVKLLCIQS